MKYQLRYLLHQLEHRKMVQVQESGLVEEWLFPLEKAVRQALESLEQGQVLQQVVQEQGQAEALAVAEAQVEVWESGQLTAVEQAVGRESLAWEQEQR